jgi:hypothetical protein
MADEVINRVRVDRGERTGSLNGFYSGYLAMGFESTGAASLVADAALAESGAETALSVLRDAVDRSSPGDLEIPASFVRACLRAGSPRLARQALSLGIGQRPAWATEVVAAEAMLAEAGGDLPAARDGFASAAEAFARFGNVPEHAHALAGLGRCLLALGETEEGMARLRESRAIWERLRATPRIAEIDALLAAAPTARPLAGPRGLSAARSVMKYRPRRSSSAVAHDPPPVRLPQSSGSGGQSRERPRKVHAGRMPAPFGLRWCNLAGGVAGGGLGRCGRDQGHPGRREDGNRAAGARPS